LAAPGGPPARCLLGCRRYRPGRHRGRDQGRARRDVRRHGEDGGGREGDRDQSGQVGAIAAYLNRLTVNPPGGQSSCPDQSLAGGTLTVTFRARAGGPALAQATAGLSGCAFLSYATTALAQLAVGGGDAGTSLLAEFNHVTGLHWKVP
jgi:hypothetical protein